MNKLIQKLFIFLLAFCAVFTLVGCGGNYKVTFKNGDEIIETQEVSAKEYVKQLQISDDVHRFLGWCLEDGSAFDFQKHVDKDITLYAKWTHTVTFKNGDKVIEKGEYTLGDVIEAPEDPVKENDEEFSYKFIGWDKELVCLDEDMVINANFQKGAITYTISFFDEDSKELTHIVVEKGQKASPIEYTSSKDSKHYVYQVDGWCFKNGTVFDFDNEVTEDMELYANVKKVANPDLDLERLRVSILGASIETFVKSGDSKQSIYTGDNEFYYPRYCSSITSSKMTYWGIMIDHFGFRLGTNESLSGSTLIGSNNTAGESDYRINNLGKNGTPDIILITLGINDNVSGYSTELFYSTYDKTLTKIEKKYPDAFIFCVDFGYSNYHLNMPDNHGKYSEETRVAYNNAIYELVEKHDIGLIKISECQTKDNYKSRLNDNLHPGVTGHKVWAEQCIKDMTEYFNRGKKEESTEE